MNGLRIRPAIALGLALGLAGGAGSARAGPIVARTTFDATAAETVKLNFLGTAGSYRAGSFASTVWDGDQVLVPTAASYCVDLLHAQSSALLPVQLAVVSGVLPADASDNPYARNLGAAAWLVNHVNPGSALDRAALQVAIWEAVYDSDGTLDGATTLARGLFRLKTGGPIAHRAASYLDLLRDPSANLYRSGTALFLNYAPAGPKPHSQDQIMAGGLLGPAVVPEPTTLGLGSLGVLAGLGRWWRRRGRS